MPTKSKIHSTILENPIEMFIHTLFGEDYKDAFCDENKMCKIAASITCATALAGSDESLKEGKVTLRWAIETSERETCRVLGPGMVDGDSETNYSTEAERGGRLGILAVLIHFTKPYNLTKVHVTILL